MSSHTFLCLASFEKGADFLIECKNQGNKVLFITSEKLRDVNWPRESIDEIFFMPEGENGWDVDNLLKSVSYIARKENIDRIVALDDFDVEKAAMLREHLRVPGMGETTARYFRDKLAMRKKAEDDSIPIPKFVHILNHSKISEFLDSNEPPFILKPRSQAGAVGIKKLYSNDEVWEAINLLGDEQSSYLLEEFIEGDIFHVDSIIFNYKTKFVQAHKYALPPFEVAHQGRVFCSRTVEYGSEDEKLLIDINERVISSLGLKKGISHSEFIKSTSGKFYFLETSSRVGGANLSNLIEESTGINLWKEWARIENMKDDEEYRIDNKRKMYGAIIISLAKQDWPDLKHYGSEEIVWKLKKKYHAGVVLVHHNYKEMINLSDRYIKRFYEDFFTKQPLQNKVTD